MLNIELKDLQNHVLYAGKHDSVSNAVEHALENGICLDGVQLPHANLQNINLDGYSIRNACFTGADLTGANMSEGNFAGSNFSEAYLFNTCFCLSNLTDCLFINTMFGATDIRSACLDGCRFQDPSALLLNFRSAHSHNGATYSADGVNFIAMTKTPIVILGMDEKISLFDQAALIQEYIISYQKLLPQASFSDWRIKAHNLKVRSLADTLHCKKIFQSKIK